MVLFTLARWPDVTAESARDGAGRLCGRPQQQKNAANTVKYTVYLRGYELVDEGFGICTTAQIRAQAGPERLDLDDVSRL